MHHDFDFGGPLLARPEFVADCGNLAVDENNPEANRKAIRNAIATIASRNAVPVVLGGDDSVPIPVFEALGQFGSKYTILQIDAHTAALTVHLRDLMGASLWSTTLTPERG